MVLRRTTVCRTGNPFPLGALQPSGSRAYEDALKQQFATGIDVVVDYLWGESAKTVIVAIAKAVEDASPIRFVHVGGASREENIELARCCTSFFRHRSDGQRS